MRRMKTRRASAVGVSALWMTPSHPGWEMGGLWYGLGKAADRMAATKKFAAIGAGGGLGGYGIFVFF